MHLWKSFIMKHEKYENVLKLINKKPSPVDLVNNFRQNEEILDILKSPDFSGFDNVNESKNTFLVEYNKKIYKITYFGIKFLNFFKEINITELDNISQEKGITTKEIDILTNSFALGVDITKPIPLVRSIDSEKYMKILGGTKRTTIFSSTYSLGGYWYAVVKVTDEDGNDTDVLDKALGNLHNDPSIADKSSFVNDFKKVARSIDDEIEDGKLEFELDTVRRYIKTFFPARNNDETKSIIQELESIRAVKGKTKSSNKMKRKIFSNPNETFTIWIKDHSKIKYPYPTKKGTGNAKFCTARGVYIFYCSIGSFSRTLSRILPTYTHENNRTNLYGCNIIAVPPESDFTIGITPYEIMKKRQNFHKKEIPNIYNGFNELLEIQGKEPIDFSFIKVEGYRPNTFEELNNTHKDRLVTVEEVDAYMKENKGSIR